MEIELRINPLKMLTQYNTTAINQTHNVYRYTVCPSQ